MRIAHLDVFTLGYQRTTPSRFYRSFVILKATMDNGLVGWGEASDGYGHSAPDTVKTFLLEEVRRLVLGREVASVPAFVANLRAFIYRTIGHHGIVAHALSALEIALWDMEGKRLGQPVSQLLGKQRDRVPVYAAGTLTFTEEPAWYGPSFDPWLAKGFKAVKTRVGNELQWDIAVVKAVRRHIGPDIALLVDAKYNYTLPSAIKLTEALADDKPFLFEEPVPAYDLDAMAALVALGRVPIAYGENITSYYDFKTMVERRAANALQPDVTIVGGLSESMRVCSLAQRSSLLINPHSGGLTAIGIAANLHLSAAAPSFTYLEYDVAPEQPLRDELIHDSLFAPSRIENGTLPVPTGPGLGIEIDEAAIARFPYVPRSPEAENPRYGIPHI